MRTSSLLLFVLLLCGGLTPLAAQQPTYRVTKAKKAAAKKQLIEMHQAQPAHTVQTTPTARVLTAQQRAALMRGEEARNNWGAPAGILSSTKRTNGGTPTTTNYARAALAAGQTATETLREMRRGYPGLKWGDLLSAMITAGYDWRDAFRALRDLNHQPGPAAKLLRASGAPAGPLSLAIEQQLKYNRSSVVTVLKAGGYSDADVVRALQKELRAPADAVLQIMHQRRADMNEVLLLVKQTYNFTDLNTIRLGRAAGVSPAQLEKLVLTNMGITRGGDATELLQAAEVTPERIVRLLKDHYRLGAKTVAKLIKDQLHLPVKTATTLLRRVYNMSAADVADALMDGAHYGYEQTKAALSRVYNLSLADVVRILSPWH